MTIQREPKMVDYVTNPVEEIVGYEGAEVTSEQIDDHTSTYK